jgi:hypothetical protein
MIGIGISIIMSEISAGVASIISGGGGTQPPPPVEDRYTLDGGFADTTSFSQLIDGGTATTTQFTIDYSGETA